MEVYVPTLPSELDLPEQVVVPYPEQYFKLPTLIAAVGPRGKGKTYSLSLWNKWMFDNAYFTRFYAIDPTYESNDCVKVLPLRPGDLYTDVNRSFDALSEIQAKVIEEAEFYKEMTEVYPEKYQEYVDHDKNVTKMDQETVRYLRTKHKQLNAYYEELAEVHEQMETKSIIIDYILKNREESPYLRAEMIVGRTFDEMHPWFPAPPKLVRPAPLLFLDDLSHTQLYSPSKSNPLNNLTLRHRHLGGQGYGITIEYAVQTFMTGLTKAMRENTQQVLLFLTHEQSVIQSMYESVGSHCTEEEFTRLYYHATAEPHDFLLVDKNTYDKDRVFRRGWDTFITGFVDHSSRKLNLVKKVQRVKHKRRDFENESNVKIKKHRTKDYDEGGGDHDNDTMTSNLSKKRKRKAKKGG